MNKCISCRKKEIEEDSLFTKFCKKCSGQLDVEKKAYEKGKQEIIHIENPYYKLVREQAKAEERKRILKILKEQHTQYHNIKTGNIEKSARQDLTSKQLMLKKLIKKIKESGE